MKCKHTGCDDECATYRQCPIRSCARELGYCNAHGGDGKAVDDMVKHIGDDHPVKETRA